MSVATTHGAGGLALACLLIGIAQIVPADLRGAGRIVAAIAGELASPP